MTVQKVRQVGELPSAGEREVRESMGNVTSPTANEILGFDWQLHKQNSDKDISDYIEDDPSAPRISRVFYAMLCAVFRNGTKAKVSPETSPVFKSRIKLVLRLK